MESALLAKGSLQETGKYVRACRWVSILSSASPTSMCVDSGYLFIQLIISGAWARALQNQTRRLYRIAPSRLQLPTIWSTCAGSVRCDRVIDNSSRSGLTFSSVLPQQRSGSDSFDEAYISSNR